LRKGKLGGRDRKDQEFSGRPETELAEKRRIALASREKGRKRKHGE